MMKKRNKIMFLSIIVLLLRVSNVSAASGTMMANYDHCGYKITSTYVTYGVLNANEGKYSASKPGGNFNAEYVTMSGTKKIVYCIEKGPELPLGKSVSYSTKVASVDDYINSTNVANYHKGSLARAIAYGKTGTHSDCTYTSYDRVATGAMAHMLHKCSVNTTDSVCTNSSTSRWDKISNTAFHDRIQSSFQNSSSATSARRGEIGTRAVKIRTQVLQHGLKPSFVSTSLSTAKTNAKVLTTKSGSKYTLSFTDTTKAKNGITTLGSGLWKVSALDSGLTSSPAKGSTISGGKITLSTSTIGQTLCATLTKAEKTGTLYKNTTGQDTVYMATPGNRTVTAYVCIKTNNVKVYKQDEDGKNLPGATFGLYTNSGCTTAVSGVAKATTDSKGLVTFNGLPASPTTYYVKEETTPKGYTPLAATENCKAVALNGSVTFKNKKTYVNVYKKDTEGKNLPGAQFGLYTNSLCTTKAINKITGKAFDNANTDANGLVTFKGMVYSTSNYYIKEEKTPLGYAELSDSERCKPVKVNEAVTFTNKKILRSRICGTEKSFRPRT